MKKTNFLLLLLLVLSISLSYGICSEAYNVAIDDDLPPYKIIINT